jgi:AraC-like DNA-binding protein
VFEKSNAFEYFLPITLIPIQNFMGLYNSATEKIMEIKTFLEKRYRVHYSYDDLAKMFGINKFKLKKEFKAETSYNIHEYVTRVRIENAKVFLENTNKTICHIAQKVGLDKSNFIKQFKNYTGTRPTEWRKNLNSKLTVSQPQSK